MNLDEAWLKAMHNITPPPSAGPGKSWLDVKGLGLPTMNLRGIALCHEIKNILHSGQRQRGITTEFLGAINNPGQVPSKADSTEGGGFQGS